MSQLAQLAFLKLTAAMLGVRVSSISFFFVCPVFVAPRQFLARLSLVTLDPPPQFLDHLPPSSNLSNRCETFDQQDAEAMLLRPAPPKLLPQSRRLAAAVSVTIGARQIVF